MKEREEVVTFPSLMKCIVSGEIILSQAGDKEHLTGFVLITNEPRNLGYWSSVWFRDTFEVYHGTVLLKNDKYRGVAKP